MTNTNLALIVLMRQVRSPGPADCQRGSIPSVLRPCQRGRGTWRHGSFSCVPDGHWYPMMIGQWLWLSGVSDLLRLLNSQICVEIWCLYRKSTWCAIFVLAHFIIEEKDVLYCLFVITVLNMLGLEEKTILNRLNLTIEENCYFAGGSRLAPTLFVDREISNY